jgi:hypothetical protein
MTTPTTPNKTTRLQGRCPSCGAVVEIDAPAGYEQATLIVAACPACSDEDLLDGGGEILPPTTLPAGAADTPPLFQLGRIAVTAGAVAALAEAGLEPAALVARHAAGDWGRAGRACEIEVTDAELRRGPLETSDDGKLNLIAARTGHGRVMSVFDVLNGGTIWVITDLAGGGHAITTVLLPEDY